MPRQAVDIARGQMVAPIDPCHHLSKRRTNPILVDLDASPFGRGDLVNTPAYQPATLCCVLRSYARTCHASFHHKTPENRQVGCGGNINLQLKTRVCGEAVHRYADCRVTVTIASKSAVLQKPLKSHVHHVAENVNKCSISQPLHRRLLHPGGWTGNSPRGFSAMCGFFWNERRSIDDKRTLIKNAA